MLESSLFPSQPDPGMARLAASARPQAADRPVFRMETDPEGRIDGSVPVWDDHPAAKDRVASTLGQASHSGTDTALPKNSEAYADPGKTGVAPEPFGFGDLVDMVNPLQHIPLVGALYRYVTGDTIKPVSQIIGSAIYGGPLGAAVSLVNVAVKDGTGRDIAGNLSALAFNEPSPAAKTAPNFDIANRDALTGLPGSAISFVALSKPSAHAATPIRSMTPATPLKLASFSPFEIY